MAIVREHADAAKATKGLWAGPRYTTHPLVREIASEMLTSRSPEEHMQACRAFVHFMLSCGEEIECAFRSGLEAQIITQELLSMELVNFRELSRLLEELAFEILSPQHSRPLVDLAALLWDLGHLAAAAELGRATLKALMPGHSELFYARSRLRCMLTHEDALAQAEKLARKTLVGLKASLGKGHADTVSASENLALTLLQREQTRMASGSQDKGGSEANGRIASAAGEGAPKPHSGHDAGMPMCLKVGFIFYFLFLVFYPPPSSYTYGSESPSRYLSFRLLCFFLTFLTAVILFWVMNQLHPSKVQRCAGSIPHGRPTLAASAGDDEVLELQWAVLQAREAAQGSDHLDTIFAQANLAATLRQRGHLHKAADILRGALAAQVRILGEGHPDTDRTRAELDITLKQLNDEK